MLCGTGTHLKNLMIYKRDRLWRIEYCCMLINLTFLNVNNYVENDNGVIL